MHVDRFCICKPIRSLVILGFCAGVSIGIVDRTAADVVETFNYPTQLDTTGFDDDGDTIFRITTTGTVGGVNDDYIATFMEGFAAGAGIGSDGSNSFARFTTSAGSGFSNGQSVFVGIADLPGFGDTQPSGPFATFFEEGQDLSESAGSVDVRVSSGTGNTFFRLLALDADENEAVTNLFSLNSSFNTFSFTDEDFTLQLQSEDIDPTQIEGIGIEFFAQAGIAGNVDAFEFHVDNLSLAAVPEPQTGVFVAILTLGGMAWIVYRRRKNRLAVS